MRSVLDTDNEEDHDDMRADDSHGKACSPAHQQKSDVENKSNLRLVGGTGANSEEKTDGTQHTHVTVDRRHEFLAVRQATVLKTVTSFLDQTSLAVGLAALAGELHQRFRCDRVVIGLADEGTIRVASISQQSRIDHYSGEVRLLKDAMQEACDQDTLIVFPAATKTRTITQAHRTLVSGVTNAQLCSLPMCHQGRLVGALLFELEDGSSWSPLTIDLLKNIANVMAPLIELRQHGEIGLRKLLQQRIRTRVFTWIEPRHLVAKCACLVLILSVLAASVIPVSHKLTADGELISTERRVITSPILGYIDSVYVDVGDQVSAGDKLLALDVRDLALQREKLNSDIKSAESEFRSAMASHDRKEMAIAQARLDQSRAESSLIDVQIGRATLVAPHDGVIVSGELSQMIGAPVERGEILLEMAPTSGYEIMLLVDEADIGYARVGQIGQLSLQSDPGNGLGFSVTAIHPIAVAGNGETHFKLDAALTGETSGLRPGQTGVARLNVGEASVLWVWTHRFMEWGRQRVWGWIG